MDVVSVKLFPREVTGKKVATLRRKGVVPVHLYGGEAPSLTLQVESPVLRKVLPQVGSNKPVSVQVEGRPGEDICFVREVQRHPVTEEFVHVDFLRVDVAKKITAQVPVVYVGEPPAVRNLGGVLIQALPTLEVEALPMRMPGSIQVDVSILDTFDKSIHIRDLVVSSDVTILASPDDLIARVAPPKKEEEPAAEAAAPVAAAEVEVIAKERKEEEEGEEGEGAKEEKKK